MKTYLFDTINRYKRFSQELDVKTVLCNKSWWVFNDSGEKEVYIFQEDGTLIISVSGKVTNATWKYISANESLIITGNNQSYMVHLAFMDNILFALQLDGTNDIAFLIEENNKASFAPKTFTELKGYFENKRLEAEKEELRLAEIQRQKFLQKQKEIEEKVLIEKIKTELDYKSICSLESRYILLNWFLFLLVPMVSILLIYPLMILIGFNSYLIIFVCFVIIFGILLFVHDIVRTKYLRPFIERKVSKKYLRDKLKEYGYDD